MTCILYSKQIKCHEYDVCKTVTYIRKSPTFRLAYRQLVDRWSNLSLNFFKHMLTIARKISLND
jgi:hypothetical protein